MSTIEEQPEEKVQACDYCRMALHSKCVNKTRSLERCTCDCARGY